MSYKIIIYKIFLNVLRITHHIVIVLLILKKGHVFITLNPKFVFEKTQTTCTSMSSIIKYGAIMSYFICIL